MLTAAESWRSRSGLSSDSSSFPLSLNNRCVNRSSSETRGVIDKIVYNVMLHLTTVHTARE